MNISRKIALTGVVTLGVFVLGSAGASAVAHNLTVVDRPGVAQTIAPVTTGTAVPTPGATPFDDKSAAPTGTTTVAPADPKYVDDSNEVGGSPSGDGVNHDLGDDSAVGVGGVGGTAPSVPAGKSGSDDSSSNSGNAESSTSGSGRSARSSTSSDSGRDSGQSDGSDDPSGHR